MGEVKMKDLFIVLLETRNKFIEDFFMMDNLIMELELNIEKERTV